MTKEFTKREIQRGYGNEQRPVTRILWERDKDPEDIALIDPGNHDPDRKHVDFKRYYDRDYAEQEIQKLFMKTWLFACREEDIPHVGDRIPFECGRLSFLIVRSAEDEFKAFYNSCIHRGTKLCSKFETGDVISCPYHAWEWNIDGTLKFIPSHWDFQAIDKENGSLREVKVGRWGGFIYVNADPDAAPFLESLGPVPEHFKEMNMANRYTAARFRKLARGNWKICQEAFMESYHVLGTHPDAIPFNGDSQTQYDIWASEHSHVGRQATPSAVPSMHAPSDASAKVAAEMFAVMLQEWHYPDAQLPELDGDGDLRAQIGEWHRDAYKQCYGIDKDHVGDAAMIDNLLYFIFPHSCVWRSESLPFTYQFTPHPTDPEKCFFEVRMLLPVADGQERPPSVEPTLIGEDERIEDKSPDFGYLSIVFDQDMDNMQIIQDGMKTADPTRHHSTLGDYQESIMQHWHDVLDDYMSR